MVVEYNKSLIPDFIPNWINGKEVKAKNGKQFPKIKPTDGKKLCDVARSDREDIELAVEVAKITQVDWAEKTPVERGNILREIALMMRKNKDEFAKIVALETGKSYKDALAETEGAIELGMFMAGEGRRFYGKTTTSAVPNRLSMVIRQPVGVVGLIIAANTPIANVAWKVFPALICGNSAILKAAEDTPITAWYFGKIAHDAGLPGGVLNIIQGYGEEAGAPLVANPSVNLISFTGSCEVGRLIQKVAGERLAKVCLELGGKNPFIVCDDADLELAVKWAILSAFSNAGQRCAAGSRIIVFDSIYEDFRKMLLEAIKKLKVGPNDDDDFGPVINEQQLKNMLKAIEKAVAEGANVIIGGYRLTDPEHKDGFYLAPTLIENVSPEAEISKTELFGPIACLYRVKDYREAIAVANNSPFGLTSAIHTRNVNRAMDFIKKIEVGVVSINGGTYGSEPHMPFGGLKNSGTGWREPGTEALDVYSELKTVYINYNPNKV